MAFQPVPDTARGSPPRAWGQCSATAVTTHASRFTPTGVGTITPPAERCRRRAVHPHGRGDNNWLIGLERAIHGSPPRAWGQFASDLNGDRIRRFTPTGVGTINDNDVVGCNDSVHPHGRGDNLCKVDAPCPSYGSPPRAWGQFSRCAAGFCRGRFTPTGVGTMSPSPSPSPSPTVHPHGRGDNEMVELPARLQFGSPPRAWGQWWRRAVDGTGDRFTPTGVGTIAARAGGMDALAVHPHGRGDNPQRVQCSCEPLGSPPRAWGQSVLGQQLRSSSRFTPTGVGTILASQAF